MTITKKTENDPALEFIVFRIGKHEYGLDILNVREIRGWTAATPLPHSADQILGVINLRGAILPIVDLSARLGFGDTRPSSNHAVVVAQRGGTSIGLLVDGVSEIVTFSNDQIQRTPDTASEATKHLVSGVIVVDDRIISVLSTESLTATSVSEPLLALV